MNRGASKWEMFQQLHHSRHFYCNTLYLSDIWYQKQYVWYVSSANQWIILHPVAILRESAQHHKLIQFLQVPSSFHSSFAFLPENPRPSSDCITVLYKTADKDGPPWEAPLIYETLNESEPEKKAYQGPPSRCEINIYDDGDTEPCAAACYIPIGQICVVPLGTWQDKSFT